MAENTHFFAANVKGPAELKELLIREKIPAIIDLCEYPGLGRGAFADLPEDERWLLLLTNTDNWERLTGHVERLVEIDDFEAEHIEQESTVYTADQLDFLSRFFMRERTVFQRYLAWGYAAEFSAAVGIPFIEMVDQDSTITIPKLDDPAGYVFFADEMPD
jgi:hypothetical protein